MTPARKKQLAKQANNCLRAVATISQFASAEKGDREREREREGIFILRSVTRQQSSRVDVKKLEGVEFD